MPLEIKTQASYISDIQGKNQNKTLTLELVAAMAAILHV